MRLSQASAAVSWICTILSKNTCEAEAGIACVNGDICSGCGICKTVCSYNAIEIVPLLWVDIQKMALLFREKVLSILIQEGKISMALTGRISG